MVQQLRDLVLTESVHTRASRLPFSKAWPSVCPECIPYWSYGPYWIREHAKAVQDSIR